MASSEIIPRERLSAWQRWELASLPAPPPATAEPVPEGGADTEQGRKAAFEQGHAAGYAEGRARAATEQAHLQVLLASLNASLATREQELVDEVLDLALLLARQIAGEALAVRRELLVPVVAAALRQLPQGAQRIDIVLNPEDVEIVRAYAASEPGGQRWQLVANHGILPGGCRIESEHCEIDATLPARWKRLAAALGRSDEWLAPG